eukprot:7784858-Ditylum_brightwellii.AAC.1
MLPRTMVLHGHEHNNVLTSFPFDDDIEHDIWHYTIDVALVSWAMGWQPSEWCDALLFGRKGGAVVAGGNKTIISNY